MSGQAMQFFVQVAPIAFGAFFVILLKAVKFPERGMQIRFYPEIPDEGDGGSLNRAPIWRQATAGLPVQCSDIYGSDGLAEAIAAYRSKAPQGAISPWHGYVGGSEDMRDGVFERLVHDELIANGFFDSDTGLRNSRNAAFEKLGILDERKADNLSRYLMRHKKGRIRLFALGNQMPLSRVVSFEGESGLLLAYLAGYDLELVGG